MLKFILALLLSMQVGCSGLATFTIVTAGTLSGEVLHDVVEDYLQDKENYGAEVSKDELNKHIRKDNTAK